MNQQETTAQGQRGILITGMDNQVYFRQYTSDYTFVDYMLTNYDVEIEITDADAALIRNESGNFLDYTAESMSVVSNSNLGSDNDRT
jgi:hypothetical protein